MANRIHLPITLALISPLLVWLSRPCSLVSATQAVLPADADFEEDSLSADHDFDAFVEAHGRQYQPGSSEYLFRRGIFERRSAEVQQQNARPESLWLAGLNRFSDWTDDERATLRGYRRSLRSGSSGPVTVSFLEEDATSVSETVDWRHLGAAHSVPDQGPCGSCWAVTTSAVLNAHHEIYRKSARRFSAQELISCVANPRHCGGKGGCDGATVELGMAFAVRHGLSNEGDVPYRAENAACQRSLLQASSADTENSEPSDRDAGSTGAAFGLVGYHSLPMNREAPLVHAVTENGPVAVSVAASPWYSYVKGIFNNCEKDAVVDHAVTLYGFGKVGHHKYWLIRNSWGGGWGEKGFIRLKRHDNEERHCGIDRNAKEGVACDGDPNEVVVCGSCGILYDSVSPRFAGVANASLLALSRRHIHEDHGLAAAIGPDAIAKLMRRSA